MSLPMYYFKKTILIVFKEALFVYIITLCFPICIVLYTPIGWRHSFFFHFIFVVIYNSMAIYMNTQKNKKFISLVRDNYDEAKLFFESHGELLMSSYNPETIIGTIGGENVFPMGKDYWGYSFFGFTSHYHDKYYYRKELIDHFKYKKSR